MPSSSPLRSAATAPAVAPTPMMDTASGLSPSFASRLDTIMLVLEPGAVTPIFQPLRSFGDLYCAARLLCTPSTMPE